MIEVVPSALLCQLDQLCCLWAASRWCWVDVIKMALRGGWLLWLQLTAKHRAWSNMLWCGHQPWAQSHTSYRVNFRCRLGGKSCKQVPQANAADLIQLHSGLRTLRWSLKHPCQNCQTSWKHLSNLPRLIIHCQQQPWLIPSLTSEKVQSQLKWLLQGGKTAHLPSQHVWQQWHFS